MKSKGEKLTAQFSRKIIIVEKPKNSSKNGFLGFCQIFNLLMCDFYPKNSSVLYDSVKTPCLGKI